ncbi:unnamed protein product [Prorocentrum cordatum]|uniref:Uncharacterized protein n=1 Tax=Prorocentrum cordatum TaxID=2364126 RepID=A0ABN9VMR0_9DINO|nr:unnamed protein product [Polarella glacialis]
MAGATPGLTCGPRPARRWGSPHRRRTPPAARTRRSRPAAPTPRAGSPRTGRRGGRRPSDSANGGGEFAISFHAHRAHRLLPSLRIVRNWPRTPAERRRKLPEVLQEHAAGARSRAREAADFGGLGQRQLLVLHQVRDDHGRGPRYAALAVHQHRAARALLVDEVAGEIQAREHRLAPVVLDRDSMVRQVVVKDLPAANRADSADTAPSQTLPSRAACALPRKRPWHTRTIAPEALGSSRPGRSSSNSALPAPAAVSARSPPPAAGAGGASSPLPTSLGPARRAGGKGQRPSSGDSTDGHFGRRPCEANPPRCVGKAEAQPRQRPANAPKTKTRE